MKNTGKGGIRREEKRREEKRREEKRREEKSKAVLRCAGLQTSLIASSSIPP